jgi:protease I
MMTRFPLIPLASTLIGLTAHAAPIGTPIQSLDEVTAGIEYTIPPAAPESPEELAGLRVGVLASHGVQESEIVFPIEYLRARGATVEVLVPAWSPDKVIAVQYLRPTRWIPADATFLEAQQRHYDVLVLTGGAWNAQVVSTDGDAIRLVTNHAARRGLVAAICAAPQVLVHAGLIKGKRVTGTDAIKVNLANAGGTVVQSEVVVDGKLITAKGPTSLPEFMEAIRLGLNHEAGAR